MPSSDMMEVTMSAVLRRDSSSDSGKQAREPAKGCYLVVAGCYYRPLVIWYTTPEWKWKQNRIHSNGITLSGHNKGWGGGGGPPFLIDKPNMDRIQKNLTRLARPKKKSYHGLSLNTELRKLQARVMVYCFSVTQTRKLTTPVVLGCHCWPPKTR